MSGDNYISVNHDRLDAAAVGSSYCIKKRWRLDECVALHSLRVGFGKYAMIVHVAGVVLESKTLPNCLCTRR